MAKKSLVISNRFFKVWVWKLFHLVTASRSLKNKQLRACVPFLPTFLVGLMTWNFGENDVGIIQETVEFLGQEITLQPIHLAGSCWYTIPCRTPCYKYMAQAASILVDLAFGFKTSKINPIFFGNLKVSKFDTAPQSSFLIGFLKKIVSFMQGFLYWYLASESKLSGKVVFGGLRQVWGLWLEKTPKTPRTVLVETSYREIRSDKDCCNILPFLLT